MRRSTVCRSTIERLSPVAEQLRNSTDNSDCWGNFISDGSNGHLTNSRRGAPGLILTGFVLLIPFRSGRAHRSWRSGRSRRSRETTVLYHHVSRIWPRGDLDDASRWKLWPDPPKPSRRGALNLHCFVRADPYLHLGLEWSPDPPHDDQLALRYSCSRNQYFCMRAPTTSDHHGGCSGYTGANEL